MKKILLFIICFIAVIFALLPFILNKELSNKITLSTSIISSLSTLITLIIALLLYKDYGIENKLLEKNLESTQKLLHELGQIRITFRNNLSIIQFFPLKKEFYIKLKEIKKYQKKQLIFSRQGLEKLSKFGEFAYNPFLPKSIASSLKAFEFNFGSIIDIKDQNKYLKTDIFDSSQSNNLYDIKNNESYLLFNNEKIAFQEFLYRWHELSKVIHDWLKQNSSNYKELNL